MKTINRGLLIAAFVLQAAFAQNFLGYPVPDYRNFGGGAITAHGESFLQGNSTGGIITGNISSDLHSIFDNQGYTVSNTGVDASGYVYGNGSNTALYQTFVATKSSMVSSLYYNNGTTAGVSDNTSHKYGVTIYGLTVSPVDQSGLSRMDVGVSNFGGSTGNLSLGTIDWHDLGCSYTGCAVYYEFVTDAQCFNISLVNSGTAIGTLQPVAMASGMAIVKIW